MTGPWRDDTATTRCPVCAGSFTPVGRRIYCSAACRKTAYRRRHQTPRAAVDIAAQPVGAITVYECPGCGDRLVGSQRCEECRIFTRRVGVGGICPSCAEPISITDLLDEETITVFTAPRAARRAGRR